MDPRFRGGDDALEFHSFGRVDQQWLPGTAPSLDDPGRRILTV
jgi:hypothetical protein